MSIISAIDKFLSFEQLTPTSNVKICGKIIGSGWVSKYFSGRS